jgi:hypothetical protein
LWIGSRQARAQGDLLGKPTPKEETMPSKGIALAGLLTIAATGRAAEPVAASSRLERRAAERGPIRKQLEAALATPVVEIAAEARDASLVAARRAASQASSDSIPVFVWVLIGLASLFVLMWEFGQGWSKM